MNISIQKRTLYIFSLAGMGLVLLTHILRPNLLAPRAWVGIILGVLPNFGAGLGLPGVLAMVINGVMKSQEFEISISRTIILATFISETGLFGWEFLQFFLWKHPIDLFDLAATIFGGAIALGLGLWSGKAVTSNEEYERAKPKN